MRLQFGDCVFDRSTRELIRDGRSIAMTPKAFELLSELLAHGPRVLSKDVLHERLWPETFVSETSLARLVSEVRKAIGDEARDPRFVRTAHGYGYAFCGEARSLTTAPVPGGGGTRLVWGRQVIPLALGINTIGRSPESVLVIDTPKVSRCHTRILVEDDRTLLEDLGSKNGTWVEGRRVGEPVVLADGDQVTIGPAVLVYRCGAMQTTETELGPTPDPGPGSDGGERGDESG